VFTPIARILRDYHGEKPNITGFDIRQFKKAAEGRYYDPWEKASVSHFFNPLINCCQNISSSLRNEPTTIERLN